MGRQSPKTIWDAEFSIKKIQRRTESRKNSTVTRTKEAEPTEKQTF